MTPEECWFCGEAPGDRDATLRKTVELVQKTHEGARGQWERTLTMTEQVSVPRCAACKRQHLIASVVVGIQTLLFIASVVVCGVVFEQQWNRPLLGLGVGFVVGVASFLVTLALSDWLNPRADEIKTQDAWKQHPSAAPLLEIGYVAKGLD